DAGLLPAAHRDLQRVDVVGTPRERRLHRRLEALRKTRVGEQALGRRNVTLVETASGRGELIDRNGPLAQRGRDSWIWKALAERPRVGFENLLPVVRDSERAADPDIAERLTVELHRGVGAEQHDEVLSLEPRPPLLRHL